VSDEKAVTPAHQWTHHSDKVLLVKCVNKDGTSYNGFQWPKSGHVKSPNWKPEPNCDTGGLFGWPWAINIGVGKQPDYSGLWIVFAAAAKDVVLIEHGKAKVEEADVVYCGDWCGAFRFTHAGRMAWIAQASRGAASQVGDRGAASQVGYMGAASQVGDRGAASQVGYRGAASQVGYRGAASQVGDMGAASQVGYMGAASQVGYMGAASQVGDRGAASQVGDMGAASQVGYRGAASQVGYRGAASQVGDRGAASAKGRDSVALCVGEQCKVESGEGGICAVIAIELNWLVHADAVLVQRWRDENGLPQLAVLLPKKLKLKTGDVVRVVRGKVQKEA
jgi:hypothetical protein